MNEMEPSELCFQSVVDRSKLLGTKSKNQFLSYSKKEKRAHILKNTTMDNFLVTSPTKSQESNSTSGLSHIVTEVGEDKFHMEKEIKSEYFSTDSINNDRIRSIEFKRHVGDIDNQSCSNVNKTRNVVVSKENNLKDNSSLNDSKEFFVGKHKSADADCDSKQISEMVKPFSGETGNKNVLRVEEVECNVAATAVIQTKRIQCPLCLKMVEKYVVHIKSCAAKRKLTTQQLMMALELQKKQAEERIALGLPLLPQKLPVSRRAGNNRGGADAHLDLALALSVSMKEAEEKHILEEADVLSQAGLKSEAAQKRSTLEGFGFASSRPKTVVPAGITRNRARPLMITPLMTRTQEDRERIMSEKVSLVLIGDDASSVNLPEEFFDSKPVILSKKLYKQLNSELQLWKKASVDEERSSYYVQELCEFVTPATAEIGCNLRHLSQIAGRLNTPKTNDDTFHPLTPPSHTLVKSSDQKQSSPANMILPNVPVLDITALQPTSGVSHELSLMTSWRLMLGNCYMSDVNVIVTRDNVHIPAHKLVIFVRCKRMFKDIAVGSDQDSIVFNCCGQTACIAFLEYLYCSTVNNLPELSDNEFSELNALATKYEVSELLKFLEDNKNVIEDEMESGCNNKTLVGSARRRLFEESKYVGDSNDDSWNACVVDESVSPSDSIHDQTTMLELPTTGIQRGSYSENKFSSCITQKQSREMLNVDYIKSSVTTDSSVADNIYDQTTMMVVGPSPSGSSCHSSSSKEDKPAENTVHKNLDMLLSLLQKDDVETCLPVHIKLSPKDTSPLRVAVECSQDILESSAECNKRKYLSDWHNNNTNDSDSDYEDYLVDSDDGDKPRSSKKPCYENTEDNLTHNLADENDWCVTQELNDKKSYYDLTQSTGDEIDNYDLTQKLNEENSGYNKEEMNESGDEVIILNSGTETGERSNDSFSDKNQINESLKMCLSPKIDKVDYALISRSDESLFHNKSEPTSNLLYSKSVSATTYDLDEKDFIDPIWDGFEDLNCNINDAWQSDSPGTQQKSSDTATEKASTVKAMSEEDTHSNSSDLEIVSPRIKTPIKALIDDMETRSPKFDIFGKKSESVKSLTFESFFKNKRIRQEVSITYNSEVTHKSSLSDRESILSGEIVNVSTLENVHDRLSRTIEPSDASHSSSKDTLLLESVLEQRRKANQNSVSFTKYCSHSRQQSKTNNKECTQKSVATVNTRMYDHENSNKQRTTHDIHTLSESSESDCDENEKHNPTKVVNLSQGSCTLLDTHRMHEFGSQRSSINRMKALLDDSFEVNDTVLLKTEEDARISRVTEKSPEKLIQSTTPDQTKIFEAVTPMKLSLSPHGTKATKDTRTPDAGKSKRISKALKCTLPNVEREVTKSIPSVNVAVTVSTPSPQIIISDKVTPMPNYSSMDTPLLKKELQRFGLKQSLGRNKSILILKYIYDQTHPIVPVSMSQQLNGNAQGTKEAKKSLFKSVSQPAPKRVETVLSETDESDSESCTSGSVSPDDYNETDDENGNDYDYGLDNTQSTAGNSQATTTATATKLIKISCDRVGDIMKQMILNDTEFYSRLLTYETVPLLEFIDKLKTLGYRAKGSEVRRYLDSQCIVYKLPNTKNQMHSRKQRRKRSMRDSDDNRTSGSNKSTPVKTKRLKSNVNKDIVNDCGVIKQF